jgi:ERCC4-type nuclease
MTRASDKKDILSIIQDTREQRPLDFSKADYCESVIQGTLKTGDYSLKGFEELVCIERKGSVGEVAGNIVQKRFFAELERMKQFQYRYIVCEFPFTDIINYPYSSDIPKFKLKYIKVRPPFILKILNSITIDFGVNIVYVNDRKGAVKFISHLFKDIYDRHNGK